jgi:uncharacterized protein YecT (DUF1311 family)
MKKSLGFTTLALALSIWSMPSAQAAFQENDYDCEIGNLEDSYSCAKNAISTEKKRLNKVYMNVYQKLSASQKKALDDQQIAWIRKRDNECNTTDFSDLPGNMGVWQTISDNLCIARETQNRTKFLMNKYKVK